MNDVGPGPSSVPHLETRGLSKVFGSNGRRVVALDRVELRIERGDFVTVVGPSGCGKTTLLNILAGFDASTGGEALYLGEVIDRPGRERAVVFQGHALFPWMSVRKNVGFGLKMRGVPRREREADVDRYLDLVGLTKFADAAPYEVSGGMQQRVGLARALVNDPEVLLMDEPFGALDALAREQMQIELRSLWRSTGQTVLFITHSVDEAIFLGTRVVVMSPHPGRIRAEYRLELPAREAGAGPAEVRASPEYLHYREEILGILLEDRQ